MSVDQKVDAGRRQLLLVTSAAGGVAQSAAAVPFVASLTPSERAKAAGAPVEVDISKLGPGR
jgi:ubiquinol-cytochrome c reductase iron-sulfur subunit